jgi:glycosyltransferase involved in cell wall biosynthesis
MQDIKVSVCTPVYGVEAFIERCARSLFTQSYKNIEYIFVNDCTPDRSMEVLQQVLSDYPERKDSVKIVNHKTNRGLAADRQSAISQVTGDYLFHLDSDDYLEHDAIRLYAERAMETDADIVVADYQFVSETGCIPHIDKIPENKTEYVKMLLARKVSIEVWGRLIRCDLVRNHHLFAPEHISISEDYVVTPLMAYYANRVVKVDAVLVNYVRYNPQSTTANVGRKGLESAVKAMALVESFFTGIPDASVYAETFPLAKLYNKVTLYALASYKDYGYIRSLYTDINVWNTAIELKHKILLTLASWRFDRFVFSGIHHFRELS